MIRLRSYWPGLFTEARRYQSQDGDRLLARVVLAHLLHLIEHLLEVVARRQLKRREVDVGHEFLLPQELADGQEVPVIQVRRARGGQGSTSRQRALLFIPDIILERIAHDILELSPVVGRRRIKCSEAG